MAKKGGRNTDYTGTFWRKISLKMAAIGGRNM